MRIIFHSDLNSFYASVEQMLDPSLRNRAIAVCGCTEERHGIVLAKSEQAKRAGVKTGQANWEARQCCPGLITVQPHYEQYLKYSKLVRDIYQRYTDQVEPFGMDECWLDVTASTTGNGATLAEEIRRTVREELGLTVSIGVSFNKIFAKLSSDMKKPDAVTVLDESNWRERVWPLPVSELLYVGPATTRKLRARNILTIGDLAHIEPHWLLDWFGKNGAMLWRFANGEDTSRIMHMNYESPIKSIGHGITCSADLCSNEAVWRVLLELAQDVGHRLRKHGLAGMGVQLAVRNGELRTEQYQAQLSCPTQSPLEIARLAQQLFEARYPWQHPVRTLTVRAINLLPYGMPVQLDLFGDEERRMKLERAETCIDALRGRFGEHSIRSASLMGCMPIPEDGRELVQMPGLMYQ